MACTTASGFGYVLGFVSQILVPDLEVLISVCETMTFGEVIFILWLVVRGFRLPETASPRDGAVGESQAALTPEPTVSP